MSLLAGRISGLTRFPGTVFKINTEGSDFALLKDFAFADGAWVQGGLTLSGTTLYGTTWTGGNYGYGTVFKINTDGGGHTVLTHSTGNYGFGYPQERLLLSGTTLYGTGASGPCSVFKVNTDGSGCTLLKSLAGGNDGAGFISRLVLSGGTLFGTTAAGGAWNLGMVFLMKTDGSGYTVIKSFNGQDGGSPSGGGLLLSGTNLFGTASAGGISNWGVVFSLSVPLPALLTPPESQTAETRSTVIFAVSASGSPPLSMQWFFNGTNILPCTKSRLELANVQFSESGAYSVVVSNTFGAVTSTPAMLNVIAAVERRPVPGVKARGEAASLLNVDYANSLNPTPNWTTLGSVSLTSTSQYY
jgi:uncharacterized repeat protein (TIGR03803 family)